MTIIGYWKHLSIFFYLHLPIKFLFCSKYYFWYFVFNFINFFNTWEVLCTKLFENNLFYRKHIKLKIFLIFFYSYSFFYKISLIFFFRKNMWNKIKNFEERRIKKLYKKLLFFTRLFRSILMYKCIASS